MHVWELPIEHPPKGSQPVPVQGAIENGNGPEPNTSTFNIMENTGEMNVDAFGLIMQPTQFNHTWKESDGTTHLNMTVVGDKTQERNTCLQYLTLILGILFIFPCFFTCCKWWKILVHPKYEIAEEFYRTFAQFLKRIPNCKVVNLTIADNSFAMEKARILRDGLADSAVKTFNLVNIAISCNYKDN